MGIAEVIMMLKFVMNHNLLDLTYEETLTPS